MRKTKLSFLLEQKCFYVMDLAKLQKWIYIFTPPSSPQLLNLYTSPVLFKLIAYSYNSLVKKTELGKLGHKVVTGTPNHLSGKFAWLPPPWDLLYTVRQAR